MPPTILALQPLLRAEMESLADKYRVLRLWDVHDHEGFITQNAKDIQGIVSTYNSAGVSARLMDALPNLEVVAQFGVGYDNIDTAQANLRGIAVSNTPDVLTDDTADIALILMLNVARRTVEGDMFVRVGRWESGPLPLGTSISGKTVGVVGLGKIGKAIAARAQGFNTNVVYHSRSKKDDVSYRYYDDLMDMARDCDFLILACAGGPDTHHLIDYKVMEALGPQGFLINIARGSVVNEEELLIALRNKTIAGAGLDVFESEPHIPPALVKMDNVVLLPHIGSATQETRSIMGRLVIENLDAHFAGKPLVTPVAA